MRRGNSRLSNSDRSRLLLVFALRRQRVAPEMLQLGTYGLVLGCTFGHAGEPKHVQTSGPNMRTPHLRVFPERAPATWDVLAGAWGLALGPCPDHPRTCSAGAKLSPTVAQRNDLHNDSSQRIKKGCLIIFENSHCVGHCAAPL